MINPDQKISDGVVFVLNGHSFAEPGDYAVKVERSDEAGIRVISHLHVVVR